MSAAQKKVIDDHCTTEWAEKVASPWADFEFAGRAKLAGQPATRSYKLTPEQLDAWRKAVAPLGRRRASGPTRRRSKDSRRRGEARVMESLKRHWSREAVKDRGALSEVPIARRDTGVRVAAQRHGSHHRCDRVVRRDLRRHRRAEHLPRRRPAQVLQPADPRQLRHRQDAARHPDLLGHRRDQLPRRPHHGRPALDGGEPAVEAGHRRLRDAGAAVRRHGADDHAVRQGARRPTSTTSSPTTSTSRPGRSTPSPGSATSRRCC